MSAALPALHAVLASALGTSVLGAPTAGPVPIPVGDDGVSAALVAAPGAPEGYGGTGPRARTVPASPSAHPTSRHPRNGRRCSRIGSERTCSTYRRGRAVRVCSTRAAGPARCRRPRHALAGAAASVNAYEGWWAPRGPSAMGRLWITYGGVTRGLCSGTLITPTVLVTAGHCLWNDGSVLPGVPRGYLSDAVALTFVPGNAFAANGIDGEAATAVTPYGSWRVSRSYVLRCWATRHDPHCDAGLARLRPNGAGRAGDVAGTVSAWTNSCCAVGQEVVNGGYPAAGPRFHRYAGGFGNSPYFCRNRLARGSAVRVGTGSLERVPCAMTAGASGGPVWTLFSDGEYHMIAVNNRRGGPRDRTVGFQPFDGAFAQLYCRVVGCGAAQGAARR